MEEKSYISNRKFKVEEINLLSKGYKQNRGIAYMDENEIYELSIRKNPLASTIYKESDRQYTDSKMAYTVEIVPVDKNKMSLKKTINYTDSFISPDHYLESNFIDESVQLRKELNENLSNIDIIAVDKDNQNIADILLEVKDKLLIDILNGKRNTHSFSDIDRFEITFNDYSYFSIDFITKDKGHSNLVSIGKRSAIKDYLQLEQLIGKDKTDFIRKKIEKDLRAEDLKQKEGFYKKNPFNKIKSMKVEVDYSTEYISIANSKELNDLYVKLYSKLYSNNEETTRLKLILENSKKDEFSMDLEINISNGNGTGFNPSFNPGVHNILEYLNYTLKYNMDTPRKNTMDKDFFVDFKDEIKKLEDLYKKEDKKKTKIRKI